ncbi:retinitis pigmentosa 1-like 1 protein [Ctenodactylus gundi]
MPMLVIVRATEPERGLLCPFPVLSPALWLLQKLVLIDQQSQSRSRKDCCGDPCVMNSGPGHQACARDAQAPSYRECLLPSVAHPPSVTQVTPAKKVTFLKRGDPRFAGVRLAVHQRAFKTFSALMDELSQRVPLSFGVRSVTTPRGLHGLSALEQLQDGGCYLCSDKKLPRTPRGPGRPQARSPSAGCSRDLEGAQEAPGTSSSRRSPAALRKITLIKNGDPRCQQTVVLSHRDTRNLTAFLSKASELLHCPVKQLYTVSGRKVDSLQALLRGPSVLLCAGSEAFRPPATESARRSGPATLSPQTSRGRNSCWGPKAKPSVIHSRSRSGSRPLPLLSRRSGLSEAPVSPHEAWLGPTLNRRPRDLSAPPGPLATGDDDVEKKIHVNEDGSLSVEMKFRLRLLGEDGLLQSQRADQASIPRSASGEHPGLGEAESLCCRGKGQLWGILESGAQGLSPHETGCQGAFDRGREPQPACEIWRNPLCITHSERSAPCRRPGKAQQPRCRRRWNQEANYRKEHTRDSVSLASSAGCPDSSESDSCSSRTPEGCAGSDYLCPASEAASHRKDQCPERTGPASWGRHGCLRPRACPSEGTLSDSPVSAGSHEESSEWEGRPQDCLGQLRAPASQEKATHGDSLGTPTLGPSSLNTEELQTEERGQGTGHCHASDERAMALPSARVHAGSWDTEGGSAPLHACAPNLQGRRRQKSSGSTVSSSSIPDCRAAPRSSARQCPHLRDTHCLLDSATASQEPSPPDRGRASPVSPALPLSPDTSSTHQQASRDVRSPSPGSPASQVLPAASRATTVTPLSNSAGASGFCHPSAQSVEGAGGAESGVHSPAPTPAHTQGPGDLGDEAGGPPRPSSHLAGWAEGDKPGACQGYCCSQAGASPVLGTPSGHTQAPWEPSSEACWVGGSSYCPTPPGGRPSSKRHPSTSSSSGGGGHRRAGDRKGAGESEDEKLKVGSSLSPDPKPEAVRRAVRTAGSSPSSGTGGGSEDQPEDGGVTPSALPYASADAVVREWLDNIPEEPILVRYELVDETTRAAAGGREGPQEDPGDDCSQKDLGEQGQACQQLPEGDTSGHPQQEGALSGTEATIPKRGDSPHKNADAGEVATIPSEAGAGEEAPVSRGVAPGALPGWVSTSTQIMKALTGSTPGRPSSLPEMSSPMATRLSHSAEAFITCLARLHFFDEALGCTVGKGRLEDSPRYQELLNLSQTFWQGGSLGRDQLDSGLRKPASCQALPVMKDSTPTSSSGVDLSSGSGGSGEGSVPCAMDGTPVTEQMELPSRSSTQRPGSRASGSPGTTGDPQQDGSTSSEVAKRPSQEQEELGHPLEQHSVNNTVQDERGQGGKEGERPEGGDVEGGAFPEEPGVSRQDEGEQEEEERRHPISAEPGPTEGGGELSEPARGLSGPKSVEQGLEMPPRAAMAWEQARAQSTPGLGERSPPITHRAPLDPDPAWVSKLLKKMEKAFMAHLAGATAELRARWGMQDNALLDHMVAELEQEVSQRLQDSTDKELRKIQSRAGRRALGLPGTALRGQGSLQTQQRRRRLQGLHNVSAFPEPTHLGQGPFSLSPEDEEDEPTHSAALGTQRGAEAEEDEFCPCEACMRKKVNSVCPRGTPGATSTPISKAFDLQQILQKKKDGRAGGQAVAGAPEGTGAGGPQEEPSSAGNAQEADGGQEPGLGLGSQEGKGGEGVGNPGLSRDGDLGLKEAEEAGDGEREDEPVALDGRGKVHASVESAPAEVRGQQMGVPEQAVAVPADFGDGDTANTAGGQEAAVGTVEAQEGGEGQPASEEENQGEREGGCPVSLGQGQRGDSSENGSLGQERTPTRPPALSEDIPGRCSDSQVHDAPQCPSSTLPLDSCSRMSQKSSDHVSRERKCARAGDQGSPHAETKATVMYPESSASGEEGTPLSPELGAGEDCDGRDQKARGGEEPQSGQGSQGRRSQLVIPHRALLHAHFAPLPRSTYQQCDLEHTADVSESQSTWLTMLASHLADSVVMGIQKGYGKGPSWVSDSLPVPSPRKEGTLGGCSDDKAIRGLAAPPESGRQASPTCRPQSRLQLGPWDLRVLPRILHAAAAAQGSVAAAEAAAEAQTSQVSSCTTIAAGRSPSLRRLACQGGGVPGTPPCRRWGSPVSV